MKKHNIILLASVALAFGACNKFLDKEPLSQITPENYFKTAEQLNSYTIKLYENSFKTHDSYYGLGTFMLDNDTDNQLAVSNKRWDRRNWKLPTTDDKTGIFKKWSYKNIYEINFFLNQVEPNYQNGKISGNEALIKQALGEAYFFRAYEYFQKLKAFGDFPIVTRPEPPIREELIKDSRRYPRNQVARFILQDLDKAIDLLQPSLISNKNRLSIQAAQLMKSRVALYEGTWLKYHNGTPFVPGGANWPGAKKDYNKDFTINIDDEVKFFLTQAKEAAQAVADKVKLTVGNHNFSSQGVYTNPYFLMFSDKDMSSYVEVILWRNYNASYISHTTQAYLKLGGGTGYSRSLVESFLMKNGLPIYATNSKYKGDDLIENVLDGRDERLRLFMKKPGDLLYPPTKKDNGEMIYPQIIGGEAAYKSTTGYEIKKGIYPEKGPMSGVNVPSENGCIIFRASEAYLNYIEAQYVLNGTLDANATKYWGQLRKRAGLPAAVNQTIAATDLSKELDWAKYSNGQLVDATLYNIRRERRCEFIAEGMRMDDLKRWRALDQVRGEQMEGFKLWGSMKNWYVDTKTNQSLLTYLPGKSSNVSSPALSQYIRPYQIIQKNNPMYNGYTWSDALYYSPISSDELLLASPDRNYNNSMLYQNPNWGVAAGSEPLN